MTIPTPPVGARVRHTSTYPDGTAADPSAWTPPNDPPMCVKWEGHYPNGTTCNRCWPHWHSVAERSAPREQCPDVHAHEPHGWSGFDPGEPWTARWCLGVEQCPPSDVAGRVALTMSPDAGRMFLKALIYAAARIAPDARVAGAEQSHEEWLQWGLSRLDAAIRAADVEQETGQP